MLLSMTGFGRAISESKEKRFVVEIKSLNSKQLDLASRLPGNYKELEPEIRNLIGARLERGKLDLSVYVENISGASDVAFNLDRLAAYKKQIEAMNERLGLPAPTDWHSILLRMPDVFHADMSTEIADDEREALLKAINEAIDALLDFRKAEGRKLEQFFAERVAKIAELLKGVPAYETERIVRIRQRMEEALEKIPAADYDRGRYEQEMIFYIEKLDITEEKQRLSQHLDYFVKTMEGTAGQGKKLGFISQEMGREINTLGSKSNHAEMQILVVEMKDNLEQIKEQVLNVM